MKFLSITISRKLFFIFLINSFIIISISGLVTHSFSGISDSVKFNSKSFSFFKSNLDYLRLEQEKLKNTNSLIDTNNEVAETTKNNLIKSSEHVAFHQNLKVSGWGGCTAPAYQQFAGKEEMFVFPIGLKGF